jgi:hypothetical protein
LHRYNSGDDLTFFVRNKKSVIDSIYLK